jgi:DNA topoisomerase IB
LGHQDLTYKITNKVKVHVDFDRASVVISFETDDGKSLHLEAKYKTIDKIREEIDKQMEY